MAENNADNSNEEYVYFVIESAVGMQHLVLALIRERISFSCDPFTGDKWGIKVRFDQAERMRQVMSQTASHLVAGGRS